MRTRIHIMKFQYFASLLLLFPFITVSCNEKQDDPFIDNETYRILIVPDIQNYTNDASRFHFLDGIADFYLNNQSKFNACFQVGDLTSRNYLVQYEAAYQHFFSRFPEGEEPYFCLGNHDYGKNGGTQVRESLMPSYLQPNVDFSMPGTVYDNYVRFLELGETRYAVLVLEICTRNEVLEWANSVVEEYAETPFIILTHIFTNKYGQIHDESDPDVYHGGSQKSYSMGGVDYLNDSMEIFEKLIYNHPNIKMVICGHTFLPDYIEVTGKQNVAGKNVPVLTVNYQHYDYGGMGYVGILEFMGNDTYNVKSYSTYEGKYGPIDITFGN